MFGGSSVVEQPAVNRLVVGSNPTRGAIYTLPRAEPLAWAAGAGKWRSMKRRGLMAKLTNHFADDQIAVVGLGDANLPDCSHGYTVKRPKIAHDSTTLTGLGLDTLGRAIGPRT